MLTKRLRPLAVVAAAGIGVAWLQGHGNQAATKPTTSTSTAADAARVAAAWGDVTDALDAYRAYSTSTGAVPGSGDDALDAVRRSATRSQTYVTTVREAAGRWSALATADDVDLPDSAAEGLPSSAAVLEASRALDGWVDAQQLQGALLAGCLDRTATLPDASACFRKAADAPLQASWQKAAERLGKARTRVDRELAVR